jgi:hypothetical protein
MDGLTGSTQIFKQSELRSEWLYCLELLNFLTTPKTGFKAVAYG